MGLDQYAYVAARAGQREEYWDGYQGENEPNPVEKPRELAYWRKHPFLHGFFEERWAASGGRGMFNGVEYEITDQDLDDLETAVRDGTLPPTEGFFFGSDASVYYREQDLQFIADARAELFCGLKVFYNSSW